MEKGRQTWKRNRNGKLEKKTKELKRASLSVCAGGAKLREVPKRASSRWERRDKPHTKAFGGTQIRVWGKRFEAVEPSVGVKGGGRGPARRMLGEGVRRPRSWRRLSPAAPSCLEGEKRERVREGHHGVALTASSVPSQAVRPSFLPVSSSSCLRRTYLPQAPAAASLHGQPQRSTEGWGTARLPGRLRHEHHFREEGQGGDVPYCDTPRPEVSMRTAVSQAPGGSVRRKRVHFRSGGRRDSFRARRVGVLTLLVSVIIES